MSSLVEAQEVPSTDTPELGYMVAVAATVRARNASDAASLVEAIKASAVES
ncbi:hypothetical protein I9018_13950 [Pseudomonas sp. MPFS]|uniref:hypothetical protein n=1 Tax=Pseudomonas sp. MPFS TaxID=2795724 RepID=UPI001F132304|nr:hypothetical protein [Pseudomonas sp. MPFS]UMZ14727.1 hypothetical protein I9018_13950 [Pseudomonas sp. MPFS]